MPGRLRHGANRAVRPCIIVASWVGRGCGMAQTMGAAFLAEFDHEAANTRKVLERVPEDRFDWGPHRKSWPVVALATHIAMLPLQGTATLQRDSFDLASPEAQGFMP